MASTYSEACASRCWTDPLRTWWTTNEEGLSITPPYSLWVHREARRRQSLNCRIVHWMFRRGRARKRRLHRLWQVAERQPGKIIRTSTHAIARGLIKFKTLKRALFLKLSNRRTTLSMERLEVEWPRPYGHWSWDCWRLVFPNSLNGLVRSSIENFSPWGTSIGLRHDRFFTESRRWKPIFTE